MSIIWVYYMETIVLTKENLNKIVKDVIESAQESIIDVMADKLENEGSKSVIQYLLNLQKVCQDGGYGYFFDEYIKNIVNFCFEQYGSPICHGKVSDIRTLHPTGFS